MIVLARTLFASLLLICQAVAQPALAQIDSQPPEIGPPIPFDLPPTNTIMLENGLKVTFSASRE